MTVIVYDREGSSGEYLVDEVAQQILVYLSFYGVDRVEPISKTLGVGSEEVSSRLDQVLAPSRAGLVKEREERQMTLGDREPPVEYTLTDQGASFVYRHKSLLKTPTKFQNLARSLSDAENSREEANSRMDELKYQYETLENTLESVQDKIDDLDGRISELEPRS